MHKTLPPATKYHEVYSSQVLNKNLSDSQSQVMSMFVAAFIDHLPNVLILAPIALLELLINVQLLIFMVTSQMYQLTA